MAAVVTNDAARDVPLLRLGFRVFYLLAGGYAALSVLLWATQFLGWRQGEPLLPSAAWHAREMLFGYTLAVIAGFLFTAVRNWTSRATPTGAPLAMLAAVWVAGRVLSYTQWRELSAVTDMLFAIGVAVGIGRPLLQSRNRRNYFFIALVLMVGVLNLAYISALSAWIPLPAMRASVIVGDLVLFIMAVVAGRVVPMFTNNAVPGAGARRTAAVEYGALISIGALLVFDLFAYAPGVAVAAWVGTLVHARRLVLWSPLKTVRTPLLWILHLSYAWIVAHLALRGAAALGWTSPSIAMHALTVGAIGGLTLGMMTRTALGHTGRALEAGRVETTCYVLIQLAATTRVLLPLILPASYALALALSAILWCAAFSVFTTAYWPVLSRPRIDGRPG